MSLANSVIMTKRCFQQIHEVSLPEKSTDHQETVKNRIVPCMLTLHQSSVCAAVVVEVSAVGVLKTVVSQALCVAKTLEDGVHKALVKKREKY